MSNENSKYDFVIGEHGFRVFWGSDAEFNKKSMVNVIESPEIDINQTTPLAASGGSYDISHLKWPLRVAVDNWQKGAGQQSYDSRDSNSDKFYESYRVNISQQGEIQLAPSIVAVSNPVDEDSPPVECYPTGMMFAALGYVWCVFEGEFDSAIKQVPFYWDYGLATPAWATVDTANIPNAETCTSAASDGTYLYLSYDTDIITTYDSSGTFVAWAGINGGSPAVADTRMLAVSGGILYATFDTGTVSWGGYANYDTVLTEWDFQTLTEKKSIGGDANHELRLAGIESVSLVPGNGWVYWLFRHQDGSSLSKMRLPIIETTDSTGSSSTYENVTNFPAGFHATCMCEYLGDIYVGGYYDVGYSDTGGSCVYVVVGGENLELLFDIGLGSSENNIITALEPYQRHIYFTCGNAIYRWDTTKSGYSHYAPISTADTYVPVANGGYVAHTEYPNTPDTAAVPWDLDEPSTPDYVPSIAVVSPTTCTTKVLEIKNTGTYPDNWVAYSIDDTDISGANITNDDGIDINIVIHQDNVLGYMNGTIDLEVDNDKVSSHIRIWPNLVTMGEVQLAIQWYFPRRHGPTRVSYITVNKFSDFTLNFRLWRSKIYIGADGVWELDGQPVSTTSSGTGLIKLTVTVDPNQHAYIHSITYNIPSELTNPASGNDLVAFRDEVWACVVTGVSTGEVIYTTAPKDSFYSSSGYIISSKTAFHMSTVDKYFSSINISLQSSLSEEEYIDIYIYVDGTMTNHVTYSSEDVPTSLVIAPNVSPQGGYVGKQLWYKIELSNTSSEPRTTPVVTGAVVNFYPPLAEKWEVFLDLRESQKNWDTSPETALDYLRGLAIAGNDVRCWTRASGPFMGHIEALETMLAPPGRMNHAAYQGKAYITVRVVRYL